MVKFRAWKVPDEVNMDELIMKVIPTRREAMINKIENGALLIFPSVDVKYSEILNDPLIARRAFWINVERTRKEYCAGLITEELKKKGANIDEWS